MSRHFRHQPCNPGVEHLPPRPEDWERSHVIVEPGNLIPRNSAVHEAGHHVVGAGLGLAVERPRGPIEPNPSTGRVLLWTSRPAAGRAGSQRITTTSAGSTIPQTRRPPRQLPAPQPSP